MTTSVAERPRVLLCSNTIVRDQHAVGEGVARLDRLADWEWLPSQGASTRPGVWGGPSEDPADAERLPTQLRQGFDALTRCHRAPHIDSPVLEAAPRPRL